LFRELGFGIISMHAGITAITELAVKSGLTNQSPYWKTIADNLSKAGWSWGCVSALDREGRSICITEAHRADGKRFVVRADERLTALLELERQVSKDAERVERQLSL
jgi:hypothetical protein